jgi:hypothetical protein
MGHYVPHNSLIPSWETLTSSFLYQCRLSPSCFDPWFLLVFSPSQEKVTVVMTFSISSYNWHLRKGSLLYRITPTVSLSILQCRLSIRCFVKLFPHCKRSLQILLWIIMVTWRDSNPLLEFLSVMGDALCAKSKSRYSYEHVDSLNFSFIFWLKV